MRLLSPRYAQAAVAAVLLWGTASAAQDTRTVSGLVTDSGGRPISYVTLDGGAKYRTLTNAVGEFTFLVPRKDGIEVDVRRIGFMPAKFKVLPGGDTTVTIAMEQLAIIMNTTIIRAQQQVRTLENRGFYDRMLQSQRGALVGDFVTPEEIEMRNPQRVTQMFEQKRGVRVTRIGNCYVIVQCYRIMGSAGCAATVYVDGQRMNPLRGATQDGPASAPPIDETVNISSVAAIEIYPRGSTAPPQYQSLNGNCAIVVIWTR